MKTKTLKVEFKSSREVEGMDALSNKFADYMADFVDEHIDGKPTEKAGAFFDIALQQCIHAWINFNMEHRPD
ncbi:unnamed protein product, partial [marine sediment metagenome]